MRINGSFGIRSAITRSLARTVAARGALPHLVLVGDSDLLDVDELGVPRTAIAHPGGVGFGRFAPTEGEGAPLVRCPGAVIVTDDGLGLAVAESDLVDSHGGASLLPCSTFPCCTFGAAGERWSEL